MHPDLSRRDFLARSTVIGLAAGMVPSLQPLAAEPSSGSFRLGLNTGTIRNLTLSLPEIVALAAKVGYQALEPWMDELHRVAAEGKDALKDLKKRIGDAGLTIDSAIGFAPWIADDEAKRKKGLEQAKRDMELVLSIGGKGIAAPPAGGRGAIPAARMAERYRILLDAAQKAGCRAHLEFWGSSKTLGRLETALEVMAAADHPYATILPDTYHMYKGGSDFATLKKIQPKTLLAYHINDYPADPPRETIRDSHRVYPGDGIAPTTQILRDLRDIGFRGTLSLELFNKEYQKAGAEVVMRTGLEKMRAAVKKALA